MNDLEELRSLLFGAEKKALDSITERIQKPETRSVDVADVLPDAVRLSHEQGRKLVDSLREPVGQCLTESIRDKPDNFADALYPVMGPAIRKSIIHALRGFAQQINETIEQSFSAKGLKWRIDARRTGVPFGDYVLQQTLLYRIEQAYLISRENGLLIGHVHHDASRIKDSDAVSAMFTAIQDFVKESFAPDRSGRLETADMGDFTLWAVHGPHALLVCVIRGVPPKSLRADLSAILEKIHFRYGEKIRLYAGDTSSVAGVENQLADSLKFQALQPKSSGKGRISTPLLIAFLVIAAVLVYFGWQQWQARQEQQVLASVLDSAPGYHVVEIVRDGKLYFVRGLRDPLAATIEELVTGAGIESSRVMADFRPYQSLDPALVVQRAVLLIDAPASITTDFVGNTLLISGTASQDWIDALRNKVAAGSLGVSVDMEDVVSANFERLKSDVAKSAIREFYFEENSILRNQDRLALLEHVARITRLAGEADRLNVALEISVTGYTDSSGSVDINRELADLRTESVVQIMTNEGIRPDRIAASSIVPDEEFGGIDNDLRKAVVKLSLLSPVD